MKNTFVLGLLIALSVFMAYLSYASCEASSIDGLVIETADCDSSAH